MSDADPEVAARMAAGQEPWPEAIIIDTSADEPITAAGPVRVALEAVRPHGPDDVWGGRSARTCSAWLSRTARGGEPD